ncbi:MAG: hypothetical protein ACFCVD_01245 [Nodosilinea sp.]
MKPSPAILATTSLLAMLGATSAQADEIALSFALPMTQPTDQTSAPVPAPTAALGVLESAQPLLIPAKAANPPMRYHSPQQLPPQVYRQAVAVDLGTGADPAALLPPAPPLMDSVLVPVAAVPAVVEVAIDPTDQALGDGIISFEMAPPASVQVAQAALSTPPLANPLLNLFEGSSNSLVAIAVGSAEGTRTPTGDLTSAYYGHTDPGNQVWNMGTFSYQHGANTPGEADQKQLSRLESQGNVLKQRAANEGLELNLEETLNGLDLANQSPLAAIGRVGYVERLAEAKAMGYEGSEAIVVARTRSYINPDTERWNAPGLGNTEASITRDQQRRVNAVAKALDAYQQQQQPGLDPLSWRITPSLDSAPAADEAAASSAFPSSNASDGILRMGPDEADATPNRNSPTATTVTALPDPLPSPALAIPDAQAPQKNVLTSAGVTPALAAPLAPWQQVREGNQVVLDKTELSPQIELATPGAARATAAKPPSPALEFAAVTPEIIPGSVPETTVYAPGATPQAAPDAEARAEAAPGKDPKNQAAAESATTFPGQNQASADSATAFPGLDDPMSGEKLAIDQARTQEKGTHAILEKTVNALWNLDLSPTLMLE